LDVPSALRSFSIDTKHRFWTENCGQPFAGGGETKFTLPWRIGAVEVLEPGSATKVQRSLKPDAVTGKSFEDSIEPLGVNIYRVHLAMGGPR
jgi:hypothetical protein